MRTLKTFKQTIACRAAIVLTAALLAVAGRPAKALAAKHAGDDTSRRNVVLIEGDGVRNTDSMAYVIDGKKDSHEQFENLKYDDILSVNWVSAENASKIFKNKGSNVLFVTTRDSEEGKNMLAKVNTVKNQKGEVFSAKKQGVYEVSAGSLREIKPDDDGVVTVSGYGSGGGDEPLIVTGKPTKVISGHNAKPYVYTVNSAGNGRAYSVGTGRTYKRSGSTNAVSYAEGTSNRESELNNLDNKLIIINDKEGTTADLKKISAFDIDKMTFKNDDDTRDKYGDKAKNGVVYIYTKKAKK